MINVIKYNAYAARQDANQPKKSDFLLLRYAGIRKEEAQVRAETKNGLLRDWARKLPFESGAHNEALHAMHLLSPTRGQIRKATIDSAAKEASAEQRRTEERIEQSYKVQFIIELGRNEGLLHVARALLGAEKLRGDARARRISTIMEIAKELLVSKPDDIRVAVKIGRFMRENHSEDEKIEKAWRVIDMLNCWGHNPRSQALASAVLPFFLENGFTSYDATYYIEKALRRFARGNAGAPGNAEAK